MPATSARAEQLPIIDIAPFRAGTVEGKRMVAGQVREAAESTGFLYISGHGIDQEIIDTAFKVGQAFFALPLDDKLAVNVNPFHRGYLPMKGSTYSQEIKANVNESFVFGTDLPPDDPDMKAQTPMHGPNQWPKGHPEMRRALEAYHAAVSRLGFQMLEIFSQALGLGENFFLPYFGKPMAFVRALHYPPQAPSRDANEFGIAPHTDHGFLTILAQDSVGGLQVKRRDGGWTDAPYRPGTFVINIADMLMRWTNDKWVSTPHRVINVTGKERYSMAFFFDPGYHTLVECIPTCRAPGQPAKYEPITWGDYLKMRFDATYDYRKQSKV